MARSVGPSLIRSRIAKGWELEYGRKTLVQKGEGFHGGTSKGGRENGGKKGKKRCPSFCRSPAGLKISEQKDYS